MPVSDGLAMSNTDNKQYNLVPVKLCPVMYSNVYHFGCLVHMCTNNINNYGTNNIIIDNLMCKQNIQICNFVHSCIAVPLKHCISNMFKLGLHVRHMELLPDDTLF